MKTRPRVRVNRANKVGGFCHPHEGGELILCMMLSERELCDRYFSHNSLSVVSRDLASLCNKNLS
ncbi:MAG: hypothetical protein ACBR21_06215 [Microcoleus sp.]